MSEQDLEEQFRQPGNWQWGTMKNVRRHDLRYGHSLPVDGNRPKAHILYVMGVSEFAEKTFELARDFNREACGFWVIDRFGQGMSGRYLPNKFKQHSEGFHHDVADITQFAREIVAEDGAPVVLLGHSTGGLIALMAAHDHPDVYKGASLTSPLLGLELPRFVKNREHLFLKIAPFLSPFKNMYVLGGTRWRPRDEKRCDVPNEDYSSDPKRMHIHDTMLIKNPDLRVGSVTIGWFLEACKTMVAARNPKWLQEIKIPLHIFTAGKDALINNQHTYDAIAHIPDCEPIPFPNGKHDLLMETDDIRNTIIAHTVALPERRKPKPPG